MMRVASEAATASRTAMRSAGVISKLSLRSNSTMGMLRGHAALVQDLANHGRADFITALGIEVHLVDRAAGREDRNLHAGHYRSGRCNSPTSCRSQQTLESRR